MRHGTPIGHHQLRDGRRITIRPFRPDDARREERFLAGLSARSRGLRFHGAGALSQEMADFLVHPDSQQHVALVCTVPTDHDEALTGQARYVVNPDGRSCEFAIVVADAFQGAGVGRLLMEALLRVARERGMRRMEGLVLSRNAPMLRLAGNLGFEATRAREEPAYTRVAMRLQD